MTWTVGNSGFNSVSFVINVCDVCWGLSSRFVVNFQNKCLSKCWLLYYKYTAVHISLQNRNKMLPLSLALSASFTNHSSSTCFIRSTIKSIIVEVTSMKTLHSASSLNMNLSKTTTKTSPTWHITLSHTHSFANFPHLAAAAADTCLITMKFFLCSSKLVDILDIDC